MSDKLFLDGNKGAMIETDSFGSADLYARLDEYVKAHPSTTYSEFEDHVLRDVCLFNVPNDEYMREVEQTLDMMIQALPAIKRIFAHPIVRLKDHHEIVPIEAVKVIDKKSLSHVASRSELWEDITSEGIKPRKLMTLEHAETYAIYENIAFAYAIDSMLSYIKKTLVRLKDVAYGCRDIHINLLDRTHHSLYFLAIGKLYLEYVNTRSDQENWSRCIEKMMFIDRTLRQKLKSPVYVHCRRRSYNIKLKKTNIFRSHKDYSEVFRLLKAFESDEETATDISRGEQTFDEGYKAFCKLLTVFSVGHFNYEFSEDNKISISDFSINCRSSEWSLSVKEIIDAGTSALTFTTRKDEEYTTCVILSDEDISSARFDGFKRKHPADEYLTCSPNIHGNRRCVYLSMYDIDSFRRIQQILLRGMIRSDTERKRCAFCSGELVEEQGVHRCHSCGAEIRREICPETEKIYYVSDIIKSRMSEDSKKSMERKFLHDRIEEAQLHFRNITQITADRRPICPYCDRPHSD